jgi:hypothetical protein
MTTYGMLPSEFRTKRSFIQNVLQLIALQNEIRKIS